MKAWNWPSIDRLNFRRFYIPPTTTLDGVVVALSALPLPNATKRRILGGGYETHERLLLRQALEPGDQVLELGASLGIVSSLILKLVGTAGRLVAVEANSQLAEPFRRQLSVNGLACELVNALCCPVWAGNVPESLVSCAFQVSENTLAGRAVAGGSPSYAPEWKTAGTICSELNFTPNVLVCDIEGAESVWQQPGLAFPASLQKIIVELHPWINSAEVAGAILAALTKAGFEPYAFSGSVFAFRRRTCATE